MMEITKLHLRNLDKSYSVGKDPIKNINGNKDKALTIFSYCLF